MRRFEASRRPDQDRRLSALLPMSPLARSTAGTVSAAIGQCTRSRVAHADGARACSADLAYHSIVRRRTAVFGSGQDLAATSSARRPAGAGTMIAGRGAGEDWMSVVQDGETSDREPRAAAAWTGSSSGAGCRPGSRSASPRPPRCCSRIALLLFRAQRQQPDRRGRPASPSRPSSAAGSTTSCRCARGSTPLLTVYLDAVEGGRVEKVLVEDGAMVQQGQLLAVLSNPELQLNVLARQTECRAADQLDAQPGARARPDAPRQRARADRGRARRRQGAAPI